MAAREVFVRVVGLVLVQEFQLLHADARGPLEAWIPEARMAAWTCPNDVKRRYPRASILSGTRVIFDIKGNSYRLVVAISYSAGVVAIEWLGTHAEYDRKDL